MGQHWAMAIGIDHYRLLQSLQCAQRDAEAFRAWCLESGGLAPKQILLLTDSSPIQWQQPTYPDRATLEQWLMHLQRDLIQPGDSLWFFFSGYGDSWQGQDYLLPIDANPLNPQETPQNSWIALRDLYGLLKTLPSDRIAVFLDINRSQSVRGQQPLGHDAIALAKEFGIPTFLSCLPDQFSHESPALGLGLFTAALLESLRLSHTLADVARHLRIRLPELSQHSQRPLQDPMVVTPPDLLDRWQLPIAPLPPAPAPAFPVSPHLPTQAPTLPLPVKSVLKPIRGLLGLLLLAIMLSSLLRTCQATLKSSPPTPPPAPPPPVPAAP
ncbi:MAG: caspase family protein, partial [Synechococcales bacterium]|nr:caspase family protein [Synechococcales bacterium]